MARGRSAQRRGEEIEAALVAARRRDPLAPPFIGEAECSCDTVPGCSVRTVTVEFKEYDALLPPRLRCPACGPPLKLHHVRPLTEAAAAFEEEARMSVNAQAHECD